VARSWARARRARRTSPAWRLRADGQGPRLHGPRGPAPRARGDRGGRHPGAARRLARALPRLGVGDLEVESDEACLQAIKDYLSFLPSHCEEPPPRRPAADPVDRADEGLLDVLPESNRKPYDIHDVISRIVDDGELFELKPQWARTLVTGFARFGGRPAGIVANQPRHLGGILDNDSADKAARFVNLCNAFGIPLVLSS
jgi:acetyl-CoA carboxylase carboxyltransferase component